jgi:hypothetical protein
MGQNGVGRNQWLGHRCILQAAAATQAAGLGDYLASRLSYGSRERPRGARGAAHPVKLAATALTSKTRVSDHVPLEIPDATLHDRKALQSVRGMICIGAIDSLR